MTLRLLHDDNKARKLKYNLIEAAAADRTTLLTFGGAYSNHIRATALAGARAGLRTIGLIRGEEHLPLNETLATAAAHGMRLEYLDRATYRRRDSPELLDELRARFGPFHHIPEGGSNAAGARGCAELAAERDLTPYTVLTCAVGSGGTLAGLAAGAPAGTRTLGFAVLRGAEYLEQAVTALQTEAFGGRTGDWTLLHTHHYGGYAKRTPELEAFTEDFHARHGVRLNRIYEAKMMAGVYDLARTGALPPGTRVAAVLA